MLRTLLTGLLCFHLLSSPADASDNTAIHTIYMAQGVLAKQTADGLQGAFPDIYREASRRAKQPVQLKSLVWKRAQKLAQQQPGVACGPLTRIPAREEYFTWVAELMPLNLTFFVPKASALNPTSLAELSGLTVAVERGSVADAITRHRPIHNAQIMLNSNTESIVEMLNRERVDGWLVWDLIGLENFKEQWNTHLFRRTFTVSVGPLYLATNEQVSEDSLQAWRTAIQSMHQDGTIQKILYQHYGAYSLSGMTGNNP